jgi:hypothetical protein
MEVHVRPAQMRRIAISDDRIDAMAGIGHLVVVADRKRARRNNRA